MHLIFLIKQIIKFFRALIHADKVEYKGGRTGEDKKST